MATWVYCRKTTGTRNKRICWAEQCPKNSEKKKKEQPRSLQADTRTQTLKRFKKNLEPSYIYIYMYIRFFSLFIYHLPCHATQQRSCCAQPS